MMNYVPRVSCASILFALFVVPAEVKAQYEDNLKWIEEAQQHQLV